MKGKRKITAVHTNVRNSCARSWIAAIIWMHSVMINNVYDQFMHLDLCRCLQGFESLSGQLLHETDPELWPKTQEEMRSVHWKEMQKKGEENSNGKEKKMLRGELFYGLALRRESDCSDPASFMLWLFDPSVEMGLLKQFSNWHRSISNTDDFIPLIIFSNTHLRWYCLPFTVRVVLNS